MEGRRERTILARHGHLPLLHRLKQRRLGARAGAVDLVGHQELAEDRPGDELEGARAVLPRLQDLGAEDVRRHQVGGELHAVGVEPHDGGERLDEAGLAQPRKPDQQPVPAAEQRRQAEVHDPLLADEPPGDRLPRRGEPRLE